ncbi:hypothetical protein ACFOWE_08190 [Planomonospora corallina]|uniref:Uncharacterized protein n=1 Tax=Planomonospora corallina TaxID=1806052 RepID=A0ABV8I5S6_9ACTN
MSEMDVNETALEEIDDTVSEEAPAGTGIETPEADVAEQLQEVRPGGRGWPDRIPFDADPADAADQSREVELDEDDYR